MARGDLSLGEAAKALGVSVDTLRRWDRAGKLRTSRDDRNRPDVHYSFAGSDVLAAQIRAGARPDVYAAANTDLPQSLHRAGLVQRPVVFARNRLVLATRSPRIRSIADAAKRGVKLAIGSPSVPAGAYTRRG